MIKEFKTILEASEGFYKEKGSKFFSYAHPVSSIEEAKDLNKHYRKKYYDARHHCFAYNINPHKPITRAADDGEPSNSAGPPILGQIHSLELSNVMVMVVRYFGGTKLGIPGMINAYKTAAKDALTNAIIQVEKVKMSCVLKFEYSQLDKVMQLIKKYDMKILSQEMALSCELKLSYFVEFEEKFKLELRNSPSIVKIVAQ